jgi:hypothetical protein
MRASPGAPAHRAPQSCERLAPSSGRDVCAAFQPSASGRHAGRRRRRFVEALWRRLWLDSRHFLLRPADAQNEAGGTRRAWSDETHPGLFPELLADGLEGRPGGASRPWWWQGDPCKASLIRQVSDPDVYLPFPELDRETLSGRDAGLGEVAVPLSPHGLRRVAEVDRVNDRPPLPAIVRRRVAIGEWTSARPDVLEPHAANAQLVDVERQGSDGAGILDA